jgi:hypothetical protein
MGVSMFNTLLVKGDINQLNKLKASLLRSDPELGEIIMLKDANGSDSTIGWHPDFDFGDDYLISRFMTGGVTHCKLIKLLSFDYPTLFFLLTITTVYSHECHTVMGFDGNVVEVPINVIPLDDNRTPVYFDEEEGEYRYVTNHEYPDCVSGRCFRNPFTLMMDAIVTGKFFW